jgi:hypothetical protein
MVVAYSPMIIMKEKILLKSLSKNDSPDLKARQHQDNVTLEAFKMLFGDPVVKSGNINIADYLWKNGNVKLSIHNPALSEVVRYSIAIRFQDLPQFEEDSMTYFEYERKFGAWLKHALEVVQERAEIATEYAGKLRIVFHSLSSAGQVY